MLTQSFYFLYSQVEFMLHVEHDTICGPLSRDAKNASLSFYISKVIKLKVIKLQVPSDIDM